MSASLQIRYFTDEEGSVWQAWTGRSVSEAELDRKFKNKPKEQKYIWIETQRIHGLMLSDGRCWDAINGYRPGNHWLAQYEEYMRQGPYCPQCLSAVCLCECPNRCQNCHHLLKYVQLANRDAHVCPACGWQK